MNEDPLQQLSLLQSRQDTSQILLQVDFLKVAGSMSKQQVTQQRITLREALDALDMLRNPAYTAELEYAESDTDWLK